MSNDCGLPQDMAERARLLTLPHDLYEDRQIARLSGGQNDPERPRLGVGPWTHSYTTIVGPDGNLMRIETRNAGGEVVESRIEPLPSGQVETEGQTYSRVFSRDVFFGTGLAGFEGEDMCIPRLEELRRDYGFSDGGSCGCYVCSLYGSRFHEGVRYTLGGAWTFLHFTPDSKPTRIMEDKLDAAAKQMESVLDKVPLETILILRQKILNGNIDGTTYLSSDACFYGTLVNALNTGYVKSIGESDSHAVNKILKSRLPGLLYSDRAYGLSNPVEGLFYLIRPGDKPSNSYFSHKAVETVDKVVCERGGYSFIEGLRAPDFSLAKALVYRALKPRPSSPAAFMHLITHPRLQTEVDKELALLSPTGRQIASDSIAEHLFRLRDHMEN